MKIANFAKRGRPNSVAMAASMLTYTQGNVKMFSHKIKEKFAKFGGHSLKRGPQKLLPSPTKPVDV